MLHGNQCTAVNLAPKLKRLLYSKPLQQHGLILGIWVWGECGL